MATLKNLRLMKQNWEELGIAKSFSKVHHFSSEKYKTKPPGLQGFFTWCVEREIEEENIQTLNRALKVAEDYRKNIALETAIFNAWQTHPLAKR